MFALSSSERCTANVLLGEIMVCVLDFKRDVGLWHGILCVCILYCLISRISEHFYAHILLLLDVYFFVV